ARTPCQPFALRRAAGSEDRARRADPQRRCSEKAAECPAPFLQGPRDSQGARGVPAAWHFKSNSPTIAAPTMRGLGSETLTGPFYSLTALSLRRLDGGAAAQGYWQPCV